jgi:SpoVK/Ycf46/Vps4 family AAA+-type ATPase
MDGIELRLPDASAKGLARLTVDQPRLRIDKQWTATPASVPSFRNKQRMYSGGVNGLAGISGGVIAGVTQLASDASGAELTEVARLRRELEDQQSLSARLESELRQIRKLKETSASKDSDKAKDTSGASGEDEGLAKMKAELQSTRVDVEGMGRKVGFADIIGLEVAKQALREAILWPALADPSLFSGVRGNPRGLLLYGPPGCGKTMLARAAAGELKGHASFFHVRAGDVMSKFYGEPQRRVQALEELVREAAPAVVFFDEVDTLLGSRDTGNVAEHHRATTNALLAWMDGFGTGDEHIFFLGATNRAEAIDEAALRRFGDAAEVGSPSEEARLALVTHLIEKAATDGHTASMTEDDLRDVAQRTENYSLADVDRLVRRAFLEVLRLLPPPGVRPGLSPADVPPVTREHFSKAISAATGTSALSAMLKERGEKRARL